MVDAFKHSPWHAGLSGLDIDRVLVVLLRSGGEIVSVSSPTRMARDYDIASLIARYANASADERAHIPSVDSVAPELVEALARSRPMSGVWPHAAIAAGIVAALGLGVVQLLQVPQIGNWAAGLTSSEEQVARDIAREL